MYRQINLREREVIAQMVSAGKKPAEIARRLGRHRSSIIRELKRNTCSDGYWPSLAQARAVARRMVLRKRIMEQSKVLKYVQRKLETYWSPDQIAGRAKLVEFRHQANVWPSRSTIYSWLNHPYRGGAAWKSYLRFANKRKRRQENEEKASISIRDRPAVVDRRQRYGDWEGDTVVGPKHQSAIVTVVDRKSGYLLTRKARNRKAASVCRAIGQQFCELSSTVRKTITVDNGTEFSDHQRLAAATGMNVYFALPYCSWQRGTNENTNGLIRQFFPKGTDFRQVPSEKIRHVKNLLNHRPRKRHGYKTPYELIGRYLRCT